MNFSEPFVRRPVGTTLLAVGVLLLGLVAYRFLPVAPIPRIDLPMVAVSGSLPGADPATVASSLAAPLERRLGQIAGVTEMTSVSTMGGCSITLQFDLARGVDSAARDVQAAINAATADLPANMPGPPTYRKMNPADAPVMILSLTSETLTLGQIYQYADEIIAQRLSQVEGVSQVFIGGADKPAIRVKVNPAALASMGVGLEDVRNLLVQANVNAPKGSVDAGTQTFSIWANDQLREVVGYRNLTLVQKGRTPVKLGDVASVVEGGDNERVAGWANTNRAILLIVQKQAGANVIETVDRIRAEIPRVQRWIPPSLKITPLSDRTVTIRASVEDVQFSLMLSIALVVMVIFVFLRRFWPTFIASVTVPLALSGTFGVMYVLGYSLDNLSLMAITISVGFVVDDAIVVIENIHRHVEAGVDSMTASLQGARQIGFTVISMSLSLVAVFIPLLFMGGVVGRLFHEFAVTLSVAILVSGVVSLTLTPMMCSRFLKPELPGSAQGWWVRITERGFNAVLGVYEAGLRWVLRHQGFTLFLAAMTFAATVWLYREVPKGFFPQQDTGVIMATTEAAQDISFEAMTKLQQRMANIVLQDPAVASVGSFIGAGAGNSTLNNGRMFITLKPLEVRRISADQIIARLRPKFGAVAAISVFAVPVQDFRVGGRASKAQYQYALQSGDLDELGRWSQELVNFLRKEPRLKDVSADQQTRGLQVRVLVDRDRATRRGVTPAAVDNILYDAFGQRQVSILYQRYNQHHVILEVDPKFQMDPSALARIYVGATNGVMVPLSSVADYRTVPGSLSVNHQGQFPAVTISFNLTPGVALGEATAIIEHAAEVLKMPSTIQGSFQGTAQMFQDSLKSTRMLLLAALVTVYVVLGILYESLVHPITILSTLPSAGVGSLLALIAVGLDLSLVAFIGIILLMGIVKKNAIMMVDFALDAERNQGLPPEEAIRRACVIRFRPIMMTTLAALFGAVPLAISFGTGSELRRPLGVAVVGGLIVSQALTLYTTPVIYLTLERMRQRTLSRRRARAPLVPAGAVPA